MKASSLPFTKLSDLILFLILDVWCFFDIVFMCVCLDIH